MLSYRHHFHAGNTADVLKHITLIFCLEYMTRKEKPILCVDTHAGAGLYRIWQDGKEENREWKNGIGKLLTFINSPDKVLITPASVTRYLDLICGGGTYSGSPLLMGKLLRKQDRLVCFELHPKDFEELQVIMATFTHMSQGEAPAIEIRREDGLSLKSLLPPFSRRGLIFIDPPWEEKDEYEKIPQAVAGCLKRFPQGTYIIWYPLLAEPKTPVHESETMGETLLKLYSGNRCCFELYGSAITDDANSPRGMYGSGLVIFNPPWVLRRALEEILPFLAGIFRTKDRVLLDWDNKGWDLQWINLSEQLPESL